MNLFINYYNALGRQEELDFCLDKNCKHPKIERVIIFNQSSKTLRRKKIISIPTTKRPTFQDFFDATKDYPDDINIITNADIYFDETLEAAQWIKPNVCFALTRHEIRGPGIVPFEAAHGSNACKAGFSQDTWIFKGAVKGGGFDKVIAARTKEQNLYDLIEFTNGLPGCDNVLAAKLKDHYQLRNPYLDIHCIHVHKDEKRHDYTHRITGDRSKWGMIQRGNVPLTGL